MTLNHKENAVRSLFVRSLVVGFFLTLAACGGASTPATSSSAPDDASIEATAAPPAGGGGEIDDSCLNTDDEVSSALEVDVSESVSTASPGVGGNCLYTDAEGSVVLSISVLTGGGASTTLDALEAAGDEEAAPVGGVGDKAYLTHIGDRWALWFGKASVAVGVGPLGPNLLGGDSDRQRAAIEGLARAAADRL